MAAGPPIVVYDACVLYPAPLRDLLMHLTLAGACEARWTDAIHDEWTRNVLANRPDLTSDRIARTRDLMDRHATGAKVVGYEHLINTLTLPDPDDRHVLAAAVHTGASAVVTYNLRDFPAEALTSHAVTAEHPDDFAVERLDNEEQRTSSEATVVQPSGELALNDIRRLRGEFQEAIDKSVVKLQEHLRYTSNVEWTDERQMRSYAEKFNEMMIRLNVAISSSKDEPARLYVRRHRGRAVFSLILDSGSTNGARSSIRPNLSLRPRC